jgi:hypothetical protein
MLLCSILAAYLFLSETHPDMQPWSTHEDLKHSTANTPLLPTAGAVSNAPADISQQSYGTFDQVQIRNTFPKRSFEERKVLSRSSSSSSIVVGKAFNTPVVMLITALGMSVLMTVIF